MINEVNLTGVTNVVANAFYGSSIQTVNGFKDVVQVGASAFENCTSLTTVDSFGSTKTIGNRAFYNCNKLNNIKFSNSLTSIGTSAFESCSSVTSTIDNPFVIPSSVTQLGNSCFRQMDGLVSVKFEEDSKITEIPYMCFDNCDKLADITLPESLKTIGSIAFWGCSFTSITIPKTVTSIGLKAFSRCTSLKEVIFEKDLSGDTLVIAEEAFSECNNSDFTTLDLTGRKMTIGTNAFKNCSNLTDITIGSGVTKINSKAFESDSKISKVTFEPGTETLSLGSNIFSNCNITELDFSKRAV